MKNLTNYFRFRSYIKFIVYFRFETEFQLTFLHEALQ